MEVQTIQSQRGLVPLSQWPPLRAEASDLDEQVSEVLTSVVTWNLGPIRDQRYVEEKAEP